MVYKTKRCLFPVHRCGSGERHRKTRSVHRRLQRKHPGRFQTDRRHGCKRGNQTSGRHSLRHASHLLPGSAGSGLKAHPCRGNEIIELMKIITAAVFLHSRRVFYVLFCPDGTVESFCLSDLGIRDLIQRIGDGFKGLRAGAL